MRTFTKMAAVLLVAVTSTINAGDHGYEVKDGQNDEWPIMGEYSAENNKAHTH